MDKLNVEKNDQMTLTEAAASDHQKKLRDVKTGWGLVSDLRREKGISRKARRLARKQEN